MMMSLLLIISILTTINSEEIKIKSLNLANRIDELSTQIAENALNKRRGLSLANNVLSTVDKQAILDLHNQLRRQMAKGLVPSSNGFHSQVADMNELIWDEGLASFASDYTSGCSGEHSMYNTDMSQYNPSFVPPNHPDHSWWHGENLWYSGATSVSLETLKSAVQTWFNENDNYKYSPYSTASCQPGTVCGHFTQMVWAKTRYIGCAFHRCLSGLSSMPNQNIWFSCNYWPAGNYRNSYPYTQGTPCSHCDGDREGCTDGLCSGGLDSSYSVDGNTVIDTCTNGLGKIISHQCSNSGNNGNPFVPPPTPNPSQPPTLKPTIATVVRTSENKCGARGDPCTMHNECCSGRCIISKSGCT